LYQAKLLISSAHIVDERARGHEHFGVI